MVCAALALALPLSVRSAPASRATHEQVNVPAHGTLSKPDADAAVGRRFPAVVVIGGAAFTDRDETVMGVPILGQLAEALADAGFAVLRYDKRQTGGSGGLPTLSEFADDLRVAVTFLAARKDVDRNRIAVVGYSEGGSTALLAASDDHTIAGLVLVGTSGMKGTDVFVARQKRALDRLNLPEAQQQAALARVRQICDAVTTGHGIAALPQEIGQRVDNPQFRSLLRFDPAEVMARVRQPILIVQGDLDAEIDPSSADRLRTIASARKSKAPVAVVRVPSVNHLLVPAATGEVDEYPSLAGKAISPVVASTIAGWLHTTFPAR